MDHTTYISFLSYRTGPLFGPVCLPDHNDEPMKKYATPVLDLFHGKGSRENNLLKRILTEKDFDFDNEESTERYLLHTVPSDERDFFASFKNRGVYCSYSGWDGASQYDIHHHSPMYAAIPLEKSMVQLYRSICDTGWLGTWHGDFLASIGIYFYRYNKTFRKEMEFCRMLFKHAKLTSIRFVMPNIKEPGKEKNPGFLEVGFVYQYVLYLHGDGYLLYETRNDEVYDPMDRRTDFKESEPEPETIIGSKQDFSLNYQTITMVEPEKGFEVEKPFRAKIDTIMSRKLAPEERKMGYMACSLESTYKNNKVDCNTTAEGTVFNTDGNIEVQFSSLPAHPDWKNDLAKDPDNPPQYRVKVENKHAREVFGYSEWVKMPKPPKKLLIPGFVDCHMHVFSPKASPLPVLWVQNILAKVFLCSWEKAEQQPRRTLIKMVTHDCIEYAAMKTEDLGQRAIDESNKILEDESLNNLMGEPGKRDRILLSMPIDIEMAHYGGYKGKSIYQQNEKQEWGYYSFEKTGQSEWVALSRSEGIKNTTLVDQLKSTQNIFMEQKGSILNFFPFDPRHWLLKAANYSSRSWQDTLTFLVQSSVDIAKLKSFTAIGYKLYTALGFRPDDYKDQNVKSRGNTPHEKLLKAKLPDLHGFYDACVTFDIPITCHCSRGGIYACDFELYYEYLFGNDGADKGHKKEFFYDYYVSPFAWENVLKDFSDLRLCLAHFGGEEEWGTIADTPMTWAGKCIDLALKYPNFYIDLAYFKFKSADSTQIDAYHYGANAGETPAKDRLKKALKEHPKLKEKILFGTDWYLIGGEEAEYGKYDNYFRRSIKFLSEIDPELPAYAMSINPKRFLNLDIIAEKLVNRLGSEFSGLTRFVNSKMHDTIEKYYL